jgi:hypothetical protein
MLYRHVVFTGQVVETKQTLSYGCDGPRRTGSWDIRKPGKESAVYLPLSISNSLHFS